MYGAPKDDQKMPDADMKDILDAAMKPRVIDSMKSFQIGTKRKYDDGPGDMWLFELFHTLGDAIALLEKQQP